MIALRLQEAATALSADNIRQRLSRALKEYFEPSGKWAYVIDVFGDDESGDVVYAEDGCLYRAAYTIDSEAGTATIAFDASVEVVPRISYDVVQDDSMPTVEALRLCESDCEFSLPVNVREARADYEVKLIAPGKGATAFYPAEALKRSGPKVFVAGTHMYWNHPTRTEERDRPERDLSDLAAVLTTNAEYRENGAKGPGLYARAKVFSDYAESVAERGPHIGLSIMASGTAEMRDGKPVLRDGLPVLKEFTAAQSADFVTRAGAGGMILTESAGSQTNEQGGAAEMDAAELKKLQEAFSAQAAELRKLRERAAVSDAAREIDRILGGLRISEAVAQRVKGRVLAGTIPLTETGDLDTAKLRDIVEAEAKDECDYVARLTGGRIVTGMGDASTHTLTEAQRKEQEAAIEAEARGFAAGLGLRTKEAQDIMIRGRAAFSPEFNSREVTRD